MTTERRAEAENTRRGFPALLDAIEKRSPCPDVSQFRSQATW